MGFLVLMQLMNILKNWKMKIINYKKTMDLRRILKKYYVMIKKNLLLPEQNKPKFF